MCSIRHLTTERPSCLGRSRVGQSNRAESVETRCAQRKHRLGRYTGNPASNSPGRLKSGVDPSGARRGGNNIANLHCFRLLTIYWKYIIIFAERKKKLHRNLKNGRIDCKIPSILARASIPEYHGACSLHSRGACLRVVRLPRRRWQYRRRKQRPFRLWRKFHLDHRRGRYKALLHIH